MLQIRRRRLQCNLALLWCGEGFVECSGCYWLRTRTKIHRKPLTDQKKKKPACIQEGVIEMGNQFQNPSWVYLDTVTDIYKWEGEEDI